LKLKRRIVRLEVAVPAVPAEELWTVPENGEKAARQALELLERIKARGAELDAALASTDPKRRAWAKRTIAENEARAATPEAKAQMAEITALWDRIAANEHYWQRLTANGR
jgi:hypothetical protein